MKASRLLSAIAIALVALGVHHRSYAAGGGDKAGWLGVAGGLSVPNLANTSSRTILGITGGAKVGSEFGVGGYYLTSSKDETVSGSTTTVKTTYDLYGVMLGYFFEGEAKGVYLGALLGMCKFTTKSTTGLDISTSPMHYGAVAGYDHMLMDMFSLGGEASYVSVSSSNATVSGTPVNIDSFGMLNFLGTVKMWF